MLVLLPPSEGKAQPEAGEPVDLGSLAFAEELREQREQLLDVLDPSLREAPAAPAAEVYTGVLYQRLELPKLSAKVRRQVLIASFLWGVVRPEDRIPLYRFSRRPAWRESARRRRTGARRWRVHCPTRRGT
jgi:uncharacterized protein